MAVKKSGLGKGLDALFADAAVSTGGSQGAEQTLKNINAHGETAEDAVRYIDINDIAPNEDQPRKVFDEEKLLELADSIKKHGIIQPLVLRKTKTGYSLVAGERRWRAARLADLKEVPCIIKKLTDEENMLLAIIENMQREDLDPIEEAEGLDKMAHTYGLTQEQIAKSISKSRPYVTNSLRLLKLSEEVQRMVSAGSLSMGHARALLGMESEKQQKELADKIAREDLSVRAVEAAIRGKQPRRKPRKKTRRRDAEIERVENELKDVFGTKIILDHHGSSGRIEIEYYSRDELDRLIDMLRSVK